MVDIGVLLYQLGAFLTNTHTAKSMLGDLHGFASQWIKYFVDGLFTLHQLLNLWSDSFAAWVWSVFVALWHDRIDPALLAVQGITNAYLQTLDELGGPFSRGVLSLWNFATTGEVDALQLAWTAFEATSAAFLGARRWVMGWVVQLEDSLLSGYLNAYSALELARSKLNYLVAWTNHALTNRGLLRSAVLLASIEDPAAEIVNVIMGAGLTADLVAAWGKIAATFPSVTFTDSVSRLLPWATAPAAKVDEAVGRLKELL